MCRNGGFHYIVIRKNWPRELISSYFCIDAMSYNVIVVVPLDHLVLIIYCHYAGFREALIVYDSIELTL